MKCGNCDKPVSGHWCFCAICGHPLIHVSSMFREWPEEQEVFLDPTEEYQAELRLQHPDVGEGEE